MSMAQRSLLGITRDVVDDLLKCQICFEKYDGSSRLAKFLPCLHGFCVVCLASLAGDESLFKCPQCRRDTPVPESGVQSFPDNFIAKQLRDQGHVLDVDETGPHGLRCGSCVADGGLAVSYCSHADCVTFLCLNCDQAHRTMRRFDDHVVCAVEDLQKTPEVLLSRTKIKCEHHRQALTVFCNEEGCQRPMCLVCVTTAHPGHSVVDLDQKSTKVKEELQNLTLAARKKKGTVEEISGRISTEINQTSDRFEEMMSAISAMFDSLQRQLKTRQETVNATLKKLCLDRTDNLKHPINCAESLASQYESACQFAERACEIGNPVDLLGASEQIISRLYELIDLDVNQSLPFQPADKAFLSFTEDHEEVLSKIERLISTLGQLNTSTTDQALTRGLKVTFPGADSSSLILNATYKVRICTPDSSSSSLDRLSGALHAYLQSPDGSSVECQEGQQWIDCYELEFQPLVAGPHQLNISVSGVPIAGSPFQVVVVDNPSSTADDEEAEKSQDEVRSDLTWTNAFVRCEHTIIAKFQAREHRLPRVSNLSARYSMSGNQDQEAINAIQDVLTETNEIEAQIAETEDGQTFRVVYTPPAAGRLTMSVFLDGEHITNSPFVINVNPLHPDSTIVVTHELGNCPPNTAVLDMPYPLTLLTCNHLGERLTSGGYDITAYTATFGSPESRQAHTVTDNQDGSYSIIITPHSVKLHFVSVSICGYPVSSPRLRVVDSLPFEDPPNGLFKPTGVDVDYRSQTAYVVDTKQGGTIFTFDCDDGSFMSEWDISESLCGKSSPIAVNINDARQLVLLLSDLKLVTTYGIQGNIVSRWKCQTENKKPASLALTKGGHVVVGDSQSQELFIYRPHGRFMGRIRLPEGALARGLNNVCVAVDCDRENVLVLTHSDPSQILRYTTAGVLLSTLTSPAVSSQLGVALTPEGALVVSLLGGILVLEFSRDMMQVAVVKEFQTVYNYTKLAVVSDGCFVAFDPSAKHLAKYSYKTFNN